MYANPGSLLVGYKFDGDINDNVCRLAFYGNMLISLRHEQIAQPNLLKIYRYKSKGGQVEKLVDRHTVLVKDLFLKEVDINNFLGREVYLEASMCSYGDVRYIIMKSWSSNHFSFFEV